RKTVEEILAKKSETQSSSSETPMSAVRNAIATVSGVDIKKLSSSTRLPQDLGFDSLMWTELQAALEPLAGKLDPEKLVAAESVSAIEQLVRTNKATDIGTESSETEDAERVATGARAETSLTSSLADLAFAFAKPIGRTAITIAQREAYRTIFASTVTGKS